MMSFRSKPSHVTLRANEKLPHSLLCRILAHAQLFLPLFTSPPSAESRNSYVEVSGMALPILSFPIRKTPGQLLCLWRIWHSFSLCHQAEAARGPGKPDKCPWRQKSYIFRIC
ncbi:hypothetical protein AVEN_63403-1 [Araneus ventricosus]|uniref:Uncharacterized protein n=1 Tax=Araneus ventricosus TaxID=182803 RepID=A0A4Y2W622_ARAVE|nr:hypothetical protein AVEN_63403-1 [Araneus ventricosus]